MDIYVSVMDMEIRNCKVLPKYHVYRSNIDYQQFHFPISVHRLLYSLTNIRTSNFIYTNKIMLIK